MSGKIVLSLHYLPCIYWFQQWFQHDCIIDVHEHYVKQSYRNRTMILTANGTLALTVPVKTKNHTAVHDVAIEQDFNWQKKHWEAICSAYNSSPFFMYYRDYFEPSYQKPNNSLVSFNIELLQICLKLLKADKSPIFSTQYIKEGIDLRELIHPKKKLPDTFQPKNYLQVFTEKYAFQKNLSILDLLFNCGPQAKEYLF